MEQCNAGIGGNSGKFLFGNALGFVWNWRWRNRLLTGRMHYGGEVLIGLGSSRCFRSAVLWDMWTLLRTRLYFKDIVVVTSVTNVFFVLYESQPDIRCRRSRISLWMIMGSSSLTTTISVYVAFLGGSSDIIIGITFNLVVRLYLAKHNNFVLANLLVYVSI